MHFRDIQQLTRSANYQVDIPWTALDDTLARYADHGTLDLDPEFQRAHVWDEEKQRRYVEFILRGGKSSRDIYFSQADWMKAFKAPMYLVDGKQRLEAVRRFMRDDLYVFPLAYSAPLGYKLSEIEGNMGWDASFRFHINDLPTYAAVLRWYIDLNAGGVVHTDDEIAKVRGLLVAEEGKRHS